MGDRIREHRIRAGLSQDALAELVGVSRQAVTKWESGASSPTAANLFKLAEIFGTTADLLIDKEKAETEENKISDGEKDEKDGRKISLSVTAAALTAAVYIAVYLAVQLCTADFSESSLLSVITRPSHSPYLWSWLLTNRLFWWVMAVSVFSALWGKLRFSVVNTAMFFLAVAIGEILGPCPAGAPYGHSHYGWAIWGALYLLSIVMGLSAEKLKIGESPLLSIKNRIWLLISVSACTAAVIFILLARPSF